MDAAIQGSSSQEGTELKILLEVLTAVKKGDFTARMPLHWTGVEGKIADTLNDIIELNDKVSCAVGRAGELVIMPLIWIAGGAVVGFFVADGVDGASRAVKWAVVGGLAYGAWKMLR